MTIFDGAGPSSRGRNTMSRLTVPMVAATFLLSWGSRIEAQYSADIPIEFRDENRLLKTVAAKHEITSVMLKELYPELAVTVGAYEELVDAVGVDSTLTVFQRQMKKIRTPKKK